MLPACRTEDDTCAMILVPEVPLCAVSSVYMRNSLHLPIT
jgi:hypothetical protein